MQGCLPSVRAVVLSDLCPEASPPSRSLMVCPHIPLGGRTLPPWKGQDTGGLALRWPRARVLGPQPARSAWGGSEAAQVRSPGSAPTPVGAPGFAEDPAEQSPLVAATPPCPNVPGPPHPGEPSASEVSRASQSRPDAQTQSGEPSAHQGTSRGVPAACFLPAAVLVFRPPSALSQVDASTVAAGRRAKGKGQTVGRSPWCRQCRPNPLGAKVRCG